MAFYVRRDEACCFVVYAYQNVIFPTLYAGAFQVNSKDLGNDPLGALKR